MYPGHLISVSHFRSGEARLGCERPRAGQVRAFRASRFRPQDFSLRATGRESRAQRFWSLVLVELGLVRGSSSFGLRFSRSRRF